MTIELGLCIVLLCVAIPVSRCLAAHYAAFVGLNVAFLGYEYADASLLAVAFCMAAIVDVCLFMLCGKIALMFSAVAMLALSFESIGNGDWLLNNSLYLSIATNTLIIGSLVREYLAWMHGKSVH